MRAGRSYCSLIALLAACGLTALHVGGEPVPAFAGQSSYEVSYWIHETPADPNSPVEFRIRLELANSDEDGDSIGWEVTSLEICQVESTGACTLWVDDDPNVPTQDGLWWVEHADPNDPQDDEFTMPPHLQGTAAADDPNDADLDYDFEGQVYLAPTPPGEPPYDVTAALDYTFTPVGSNDPIGDGDDEPVEVPPDGGQPGDPG